MQSGDAQTAIHQTSHEPSRLITIPTGRNVGTASLAPLYPLRLKASQQGPVSSSDVGSLAGTSPEGVTSTDDAMEGGFEPWEPRIASEVEVRMGFGPGRETTWQLGEVVGACSNRRWTVKLPDTRAHTAKPMYARGRLRPEEFSGTNLELERRRQAKLKMSPLKKKNKMGPGVPTPVGGVPLLRERRLPFVGVDDLRKPVCNENG